MKKSLVLLLSLTFAIIFNSGIKGEGSQVAKIIYEGKYVTTQESIHAAESIQSKDETIYLISIELNYEPFNLDKDHNFIDNNVDNYIRMVKDAGKNYHSEKNHELINTLELDSKSNIRVSQYAPFIYYNEDMSYEALLPSLEKLSTDENVTNIYVSEVSQSSAVSEGRYIPYYDVNAEIVMNEGIYDGTEVNVGIIDNGIVDKSDPNFIDQDVEVGSGIVSHHATEVASFIGGKYGMAPNVNTFSVHYKDKMQDEIDWLIDRDVNVINISISDQQFGNGTYTSNAKYIDYITRRYWVTFVGSAGNYFDSNVDKNKYYITSPKTAANMITVGSARDKYHVSDFSAYVYTEKYYDKPTLIAPGEFLTLPDGSDANPKTGTSYSSAIVTATVALLMDKQDALKAYPEKVLSILTASSTMDRLKIYHNTYENSGLEEKAGAGLLDVEEALKSTSTTESFIISSNTGANSYVYTKSVYLEQGQKLRVAAAWLKNVESTIIGYDDHEVTDYDLSIIGVEGYKVKGVGSFDNNIEVLEYKATKTGNYKIKLYQWGSRHTTMSDFGSVTYTID